MTMLDWFAGQALAGITSSEMTMGFIGQMAKETGVENDVMVAETAYSFAHAMIAARERRMNQEHGST